MWGQPGRRVGLVPLCPTCWCSLALCFLGIPKRQGLSCPSQASNRLRVGRRTPWLFWYIRAWSGCSFRSLRVSGRPCPTTCPSTLSNWGSAWVDLQPWHVPVLVGAWVWGDCLVARVGVLGRGGQAAWVARQQGSLAVALSSLGWQGDRGLPPGHSAGDLLGADPALEGDPLGHVSILREVTGPSWRQCWLGVT